MWALVNHWIWKCKPSKLRLLQNVISTQGMIHLVVRGFSVSSVNHSLLLHSGFVFVLLLCSYLSRSQEKWVSGPRLSKLFSRGWGNVFKLYLLESLSIHVVLTQGWSQDEVNDPPVSHCCDDIFGCHHKMVFWGRSCVSLIQAFCSCSEGFQE